MRLIDSEARVTVFSFDIEHEEYEHTEMSVVEALDFATDEGCPDFVDAEPVIHGRWISKSEEGVYGPAYCSICDFELRIDDTPYCPMCGAKMDKEG